MDEGLKKEIDKLISIGKRNGYLNRSTLIHLLSGKKAIDEYAIVVNYMIDQGVQFIEEDVEYEAKDSLEDLPVFYQPFDSTKINIAQKPISLEGIIKRLLFGEINMNTDFQRKSGLWDDVTKSQLIESMMLRIPIPVFYFDGTFDDKWLVIDGLQRLSTFKEFFIDKSLKLTGMEYFTDYNGCTYDDLPRTYIRRMEETQLALYIIQPGTPESVKFNIFKRINTPGLKLDNQEIRHALFHGKSTELLKSISESKEFQNITGNSLSNERMLASEVVLRYLAFVVCGIDRYEELEGNQDLFLIDSMKQINCMSDSEIDKIKNHYYDTLNRVWQIFSIYSFRKMTDTYNSRKNPFNVALYETWMINLGNMSSENYRMIIQRKEMLISKFVELLQTDKTFGYDISSAKRTAVLRRIETVGRIIREVLNG